MTHERRSWTMSRVRSKNTKPEIIVRSLLHKMGYRFRLHGKGLPGIPDIVLRKYKTAIFVNRCFWHYHKKCKKGTLPKSNTEFWKRKFERNASRDIVNLAAISAIGWKAVVVWECELNDIDALAKRLNQEIRT